MNKISLIKHLMSLQKKLKTFNHFSRLNLQWVSRLFPGLENCWANFIPAETKWQHPFCFMGGWLISKLQMETFHYPINVAIFVCITVWMKMFSIILLLLEFFFCHFLFWLWMHVIYITETYLDLITSYCRTSRKRPPKCHDWVVAYRRWSFTRIKPQVVSSEKRSGHIYFMEDNLLHARSKLEYL